MDRIIVLFFFASIHNFQAQTIDPFFISTSESDEYHGIKILDQYRGLEDIKNPNVISWLEDQSDISQKVVDSIPGRDYLVEFQKSYSQKNTSRIYRTRITPDGQYFYLKKTDSINYARIFYRKSLKENEKLLIDIKKDDRFDTFNITYIQPSWNGNYVAIGITKPGNEYGSIIVYNVAQGKLHKAILQNTAPASLYGIEWLPDNSGFFYLELSIVDPTSPEYLLNTKAKFHRIGSYSQSDKVILDPLFEDKISINKEDFPVLRIYGHTSEYMYLLIEGSAPFNSVYYAPISELYRDSINWEILHTVEDQVKRFIPIKDTIYYKTALRNSNFSICKTSVYNPKFDARNIIVPAQEEKVITDFDLTSEGLYFVIQKNGVQSNLFFLNDDDMATIELPNKSGRVSINAYNKYEQTLLIAASGWLNETRTYTYTRKRQTFEDLNLNKKRSFEKFDDLQIIETEIPSHDGVLVPVSIIMNKSTQRNGQNPTFFFGYGSYGSTISPFYQPIYLEWVAKGGIFVVAHTRGGGEKGIDWHNEGRKTTKSNTWKDYIAVTEFMIDEGYTNPEFTVAWGSSAGAIMAGRAITERPELYKVALFSSPFFNAIRSELQPNGLNSVKEFGTIKNEAEFKALAEMDSYHHIQPNTEYPAILITGGYNDGRTVIWDAAKFYAKMKNESVSKNPILFQIDFNAGHGAMNNGTNKVHQLYADLFAFAFWQTGHPDFQPKQ